MDAATGTVLDSGVLDLSRRRGEDRGAMFLRFRRWLEDFFVDSKEPPSLLVYEQAHHRGGDATEICVGLCTRIMEIAAEHDLPSVSCHSANLKKFATGKGNAGKPMMMAASVGILGREPVDDNEADAVHLASWGRVNYLK